MIVVMKEDAQKSQIEHIVEKLEGMGFSIHEHTGASHTILGVVGDTRKIDVRDFEIEEGVFEVLRVTEPYKLASRAFHPDDTLIKVKDIVIGGNEVVVMAGPCSVENQDQVCQIAELIQNSGAKLLRGGAFKPRSSPYSFQGLGEEGLKILKHAGDQYHLITVSEVMDVTTVELVADYIDILQIGARNMQNFPLLKRVGKCQNPVLLKRGMSATIEEMLMAAEYIMAEGNLNVILCERGIRTFEPYTRNTMDISAIPVSKKRSHLPIVADPSHAIGIRDKVAPMARAAIAAGADGLMIEVHPDPDKAFSDGAQTLYPRQFEQLMTECRTIAQAIGRTM